VAAPRTRHYLPDADDVGDALPGVLAAAPGVAASGADLWRCVFGNDAPVEIEVGCGRGTFLLEAARHTPSRNFLGLERAPRLALAAERAIAGAALTNARVLCCDAGCVLCHLIPPRSVAVYHLYFPDPWWKRRHHKRRVYTGRFAAAISRTLVAGGRVYVATDVRPLVDQIRERFARAGLAALGESPPAPHTVFAGRCREAGRLVHHAAFGLSGPPLRDASP
jgi:tRNA (guanine-N7-)-methyltransferase